MQSFPMWNYAIFFSSRNEIKYKIMNKNDKDKSRLDSLSSESFCLLHPRQQNNQHDELDHAPTKYNSMMYHGP